MNGVLVIDKPAGVTSRHIDNVVRKRVGRRVRVGHAGTLDPFATGVLPILVGEATKLSPYLTGCEKRYQATLLLGQQTDTADCEGRVIREAPAVSLVEEQIHEAMQALTGELQQQVPAYSAVRINGERLYEQARRGDTDMVLPVRQVRTSDWTLERFDAASITFSVTCSAGTYVRVLGEQVAAQLGTLGHLTALRRLRSGKIDITQAVSLEQALDELPLVSLEAVLDLPVLALDGEQSRLVGFGRKIETDPDDGGADIVQARNEQGRLLAILERQGATNETPSLWRILRGFSGSE